jgi:hypothetical protein
MKLFSFLSVCALALICSYTSNAQAGGMSPCGTPAPDQQWEMQMQELVKIQQEQRSRNVQMPVYTIPVIIHVIHGGQSIGVYPNLAQGQLNSQIQVLNNDYGGIGYNSGNYPTNAFTTYASVQSINAGNLDGMGRVKIANCNIQFCLATTDTLGNPLAEPGIERINYASRGWPNPASQSSMTNFKNLIDNVIKPQTIWNVSKFLNIWITDENLNAIGLLGYATFPPLTTLTGLPAGFYGTATTDGFWCYARAFGSVGTYPGGYYTNGNQRGRTCTHEIGHFLGLRHIWGDGQCATDYCNDTPTASGSNFGAPSFPYKTTSCAGNTTDGEMFMNFMDYVDDGSKYMFTSDQANRIQATMASSPYRKFMGTHNLCTVLPIAATSQFNINPNICGNVKPVKLTNLAYGTPVPDFTWTATGGAVFIPDSNSAAVTVSFPAGGTYTITLTSDNGTTSTSSRVINVDAPEIFIDAPETACLNQLVELTASGAEGYTWLPDSVIDPSVFFIATNPLTSFTCLATSQGSCSTSKVVSVALVSCVGINANTALSDAYRIFPQPAAAEVIIKANGNKGDVVIKISDITGKLLLEKPCSFYESGQARLDCSTLANGIYLMVLNNGDGTSQTLKFIKQN